jgi:hypothetical protein
MQTYEVVMIAVTLFVGLSIALYSALPAALLNHASRHGRYAGLGKPDRPDDSAAGNAPIAAMATLQGQLA